MSAITYLAPKFHRNIKLIYFSLLLMVAAAWCGHCWVAAGEFSDPALGAAITPVATASGVVPPGVEYLQSGPALMIKTRPGS